MGSPALPYYCSMGLQDNATDPYHTTATGSVGGMDFCLYPDDGQPRPICLSPFVLEHQSFPSDQSFGRRNDKSTNSEAMDTDVHLGYAANASAVSPQMYSTVAAPSSSPWQGGSNSCPTGTTASTRSWLSPQPNLFGAGVPAGDQYCEVDQRYNDGIATVFNEYPEPTSPISTDAATTTTGGGSTESGRKKKRRHGSSSGTSGSTPPISRLDGSTTNPHRTTQLRTTQRSSKYSNSSHKPAETMEEQKARAMHNQVEQQYRKRLNAQFERLLAALPPDESSNDGGNGGAGGSHVVDGEDRRVSKAEVLDRARQRIKTLEKETASLERQNHELFGNVGRLRKEWARRMGGCSGF